MLLLECTKFCPLCHYLFEGKIETHDSMLRISKPNSKLSKSIGAYSLDLLAGVTCPGAAMCFAQHVETEGQTKVGTPKTKIVDVPPGVDPEEWKKKHGITDKNKFRCYAATAERMPAVYMQHKSNYNLLKELGTTEKMADGISDAIIAQIPRSHRGYFRIHASGDFYNETYFKAWIEVAKRFPQTIFYAYTKVIPMVLKHENEVPPNLRIALSFGSKWDAQTMTYGKRPNDKRKFKIAYVVFSEEEAAERGLEIDRTDELAAEAQNDFALILHGAQPAGSEASKSWEKLKKKHATE